jgi:hypothetical protein
MQENLAESFQVFQGLLWLPGWCLHVVLQYAGVNLILYGFLGGVRYIN